MMNNVLGYLEESARRQPEHVAVVDTDGSTTYRELAAMSRRIGSRLARSCQPRQPIVICMDKGIKALAVMMGTVYAGCFYVYIDPIQPAARRRRIIDVCRPALAVIADGQPADGLDGVAIIRISELADAQEDDELLGSIRSQTLDIDPLYCNFTSGSTGTPKGVLVSHRSVIDFMNYFPALFGIGADDVIGNQAPFDFDVSVKDIYSCFSTGATLVLIPRICFSVITRLLDWLDDNHVTTLIWAVSALCLVPQFKGFDYKIPSKVDKVLFSGEPMPIKYLNMWRQALPAAHFVNLYGPTEITCNCTYYRVERPFELGEILPIGQPFPNEQVLLMDSDGGMITAQGAVGEICVTGTALALGYYNDPVQTAKVFVQNPLYTGYPQLMYRTGDLGYRDGDGNLCFSGRSDFQIKIMGHRIELEEVEAAISGLPGIERACCCYDARRQRIVAFYCGRLAPLELKKQLHALLPGYMVPSAAVSLEQMPLTLNGKIDRHALMAMEVKNG